jgi:hypothetical protein
MPIADMAQFVPGSDVTHVSLQTWTRNDAAAHE